MRLGCSIPTVVLCGFTALFQSSEPTPAAPPQGPSATTSQVARGEKQSQPANELVRTIVANELKAADEDHSHWMYQLETMKAGTLETRRVVETKDGDVTRVVSRNGKPLSAEEQKVEEERVDKFIHDPREQQKQQKDARQDAHKTRELLALLPDALTYSSAESNGSTTKLKFEPNPDFQPPSREAHVFHEMAGELVLDTKQQRLVEFTGHLIHPVDFGGGLLGHLEEGGTFDVRQQEVAPNIWEITLLTINMKGRALFFKTISVQQDEKRSEFQRVSDTLSLTEGEDLLRKQVAAE